MKNSEKKNNGVTISHGTAEAHKRSFAQPLPKSETPTPTPTPTPPVQSEEEKLKAAEKHSKGGKKYQ